MGNISDHHAISQLCQDALLDGQWQLVALCNLAMGYVALESLTMLTPKQKAIIARTSVTLARKVLLERIKNAELIERAASTIDTEPEPAGVR